MTGMQQLGLGTNNSNRDATHGVVEMTGMQTLILSTNKFTGTLPTEWFTTWVNISTMDLRDNLLTGTIPPIIFSQTNLTVLVIRKNSFSGPLPTDLHKLSALLADRNKLSGTLPPTALHLRTLTLTGNRLAGSLPSQLFYPRVTHMLLRGNDLTGALPVALASSPSLEFLDLSANRLTGTLPPVWSSNATHVLLGANQFGGTVPRRLVGVEGLKNLSLFSNDLSCKLQGMPPAGVNFDVLTGNAFACLGPNDPFRRVDIFESDYICEWWRILNLSVFAGVVGAGEGLRSVVLLALSPLIVVAVSLVLFMGAFVLVRGDAGQDTVADTAIGPRESVVELRQRGAGSSSAENAVQGETCRPDEEEAAAYVAFQQICTIACVGAAGVALFILVPAYAGGKSRLECPGIRRVSSSRLLHAVPGVLGRCGMRGGVFAYWYGACGNSICVWMRTAWGMGKARTGHGIIL